MKKIKIFAGIFVMLAILMVGAFQTSSYARPGWCHRVCSTGNCNVDCLCFYPDLGIPPQFTKCKYCDFSACGGYP